MPPPYAELYSEPTRREEAELPDSVELLTVSVPELKMPPPCGAQNPWVESAKLPDSVELLTVSVPEL